MGDADGLGRYGGDVGMPFGDWLVEAEGDGGVVGISGNQRVFGESGNWANSDHFLLIMSLWGFPAWIQRP